LLLPPDVAGAYPVLPRYTSGQFHLHRDKPDDVELLMNTFANRKFVSKTFRGKLGIVHSRKAETYLSRSPECKWISFVAFTSGITPPTPTLIRTYFQEAEHSTLMPYGFSNFDRYEREMQSVSLSAEDKKVAFDWTFQTTKNYNLPGANAVFTGNKGYTKEIITLALVPTSAASQISHLLLQSKKGKAFKPAVSYTDTCPHNEAFWKTIFGPNLETKLGLFHLLHHIMDTLDPTYKLYWKCAVKLRNAIYTYFVEDEAALLCNMRLSKKRRQAHD
jgi:hypothetical protein